MTSVLLATLGLLPEGRKLTCVEETRGGHGRTGTRSPCTALSKSARRPPPSTPDPRYARHLPADYAYVIEELITEKAEVLDKEAYYDSIVDTIIDIGRCRELHHRSG